MEATVILSPISPIVLIAIGIVLIAFETFLFSFIVAWFGAALVFVGIGSYFYAFEDGIWQIAISSILALLMLFSLRAKALEVFLKSKDKEIKEDFFNTEGVGEIKDGKLFYKSIYWTIENADKFDEGEKVKVLEALKGKAKIEKLQ